MFHAGATGRGRSGRSNRAARPSGFVVVVTALAAALLVPPSAAQRPAARRASRTPAPCGESLLDAAIKGDAACVERLLASRPLSPSTDEGLEPLSPLVAASALGHTRVVGLLLPAFPSHVNRALVVAAGGRPDRPVRPETIELLLKQPPGQYGGVPARNLAFGIALLRCHDDSLAALKSAGVHSGAGAFQVAMNNPMRTVDRQLYDLGATDPWMAAQLGDLERLRQLLAASGPDPRTACGETPLMRAAAYNQAGALKHLLSRGADPRAKDKSGRTALALGADYPEIVRALEEAGANK